jgi:tetratricopeptide (TPR) repeat protein
MASRWPEHELAPQALYRAGLGYREGGDPDRAVAAWNRYLAAYPDHEYTKDAHLQIASTWEAAGRTVDAARAYERVSLAFPEDEGAPDALLKAADLLGASGDAAGAEELQLSYVERFPGDVETGMAILAGIATRELDTVGPERPVSTLTRPGPGGEPAGRLGAYLELAEAHPDLASPAILARVRFLEGEELFPAYRNLALTQPLDASIERKKAGLEELIAAYGKCADWGVAEWTRASAYRIGEALLAFGTALEESERPVDLSGDDLFAYEDVLYEEAWAFQDKAEAAWSDILRETMGTDDDPGGWIARTQETLWPRLAQRFLFMPEVEFPMVAGKAPVPPVTGEEPPPGERASQEPGAEGTATPSQE